MYSLHYQLEKSNPVHLTALRQLINILLQNITKFPHVGWTEICWFPRTFYANNLEDDNWYCLCWTVNV